MNATANRIPIVMYHYIRPLHYGSYKNIKGLDVEDFRAQIRHLKRYHNVLSMNTVTAALQEGESLPEDACVLTFDDGYSDHYRYAFPILMQEGLSGAFYAPKSVVMDRKVLEVNKVHFIIACSSDIDALEGELDAKIESERAADLSIPSVSQLKADLRHANRFDPANVIYIKRALQHALPEEVRARISAELFEKIVTKDEAAFAEELYVSIEQTQTMHDCGMVFGGHGNRHLWHSRLDEENQRKEIEGANLLLDEIGTPKNSRTYCYPYGDHDDTTVRLLAEYGYTCAFTSNPNLTNIAQEDPFRLSRLDTNDIPKQEVAQACNWTQIALGELVE